MPEQYTIAIHMNDSIDPVKIGEAVKQALKRLQYDSTETLPLLTASGKVLTLIIDNPGITLREIAVRLGVTEANIQRIVANLHAHKLVKRTIVNRQHHYQSDTDAFLNHPDVRRTAAAIIATTRTVVPEG